jgi:hypothetical protein
MNMPVWLTILVAGVHDVRLPKMNTLKPGMIALLMTAASGFGAMQEASTNSYRFKKEQAVYVVAVKSVSRNLAISSADLEVERRAKEQFKKEKAFRVVNVLNQADFVFFILVDDESSRTDEIALAVLTQDYRTLGKDLDGLRSAAIWQDSGHMKVGRHAALAGATVGLSAIFDRPSVSKGLVKQFHRDVFPRK